MKPVFLFSIIILTIIKIQTCCAYPLDGYPYTGIIRLEGHRLVQQKKIIGQRVNRGALLRNDQILLRLSHLQDFQYPVPNEKFTAQIKKVMGDESGIYGIAVLDFTNMDSPRYAEVNGSYRANPGSVGKLVVALGIFQALADIYPDNTQKRLKILRTTLVRADKFILSDHHKVPFWEPGSSRIKYRPLKTGDEASLWTYLDWMMSASSNAAASIVIRELMLLNQFGLNYPVSREKANAFFEQTPKAELARLLAKSLQEPVSRNGLDLNKLRQGSFFTRKGKRLVPGTTSHATPRELMRFSIKLEQGKLVDTFSSLEIKRLLYMTQKRIRYASSPALYYSAVYFKSGSLYKCRPEPGFKCLKYRGNVLNMLNSLAIVEHPASNPKLTYIVVVMSNVLRKNSAVLHQTLGTRIHRLIEAYHNENN